MTRQKLKRSAARSATSRLIAGSSGKIEVPDICRCKGTVTLYREMVRLSRQLREEIEILQQRLAKAHHHDGVKGWAEIGSMNEEADRLSGSLAAKQSRLNFMDLKIRLLVEHGWNGKTCAADGCDQSIGKQRLKAKREAVLCARCRKWAESSPQRRIKLKFGFVMSLAA